MINDTTPVAERFCTKGGPNGPQNSTIDFDSVMNVTYDFNVIRYNYMSCAMSAKAINNLIIGLVVSVILLAIIIYIVFVVRRKMKIAKILKQQAK